MLKQFILKKFLILLKKFVFCIASAQRLRDIFWCTCSAVALRACIRLGPHVCCRTVSMRCPGALAQLQHRVRAYDLGRMFAAAQSLCVVLVHLLSCSTACVHTTWAACLLPRSLYALSWCTCSAAAAPACLRLRPRTRCRAASMRCPGALAQLQQRLPAYDSGRMFATAQPLCIVLWCTAFMQDTLL
jgi:hypothetical protein